MADRLDAESRLLFPITFAIFCTVYWGYYTWSDTLGIKNRNKKY